MSADGTVRTPYDFLDRYPHPAFVLPSDWDTHRAPTWSNEAWRVIARGHSLYECSSADACKHLSTWIGTSLAPLRIEFTFGLYNLAQTATDDGIVVTTIPSAGTPVQLSVLNEYGTVDDFAKVVLDAMRDGVIDVPFAILYNVERRITEGNAKVGLSYSGAVRAPYDHILAPVSSTISLGTDTDAWKGTAEERGTMTIMDATGHWPFATALRTRRPVFITDCTKMIQGFEPRPGQELPTTATIIPVARNADSGFPNCVFLVGLLFKEFSSAAEMFIHSLRLQLASFLDRTMSERTTQSLIQQLATIDKVKNQLLANVANELMAPIGLISGPLDDLKSEIPSGAASQLLGLARRNIGRLRSLVGTLVEVSVIHHTPETATFVRTNVGVFTRDISSMFAKAIEKSNGRLTIDCDLSDNPVFIDRQAWEKITVTVLRMATRYHNGLVHVGVSYTESRMVFTAKGVISFHIAEVGSLSSETDAPGGVVLDYALVKQVVDMHGGAMSVDHEDGVSLLTISLPLGSGHLPQGSLHQGPELVYELSTWDDSEDDTLEAPSMSMLVYGVDRSTLQFEEGDSVLLVNDVDSTRYMRTIFQPFCTVYEARNTKEALDIVKKTPPTLVIADAHLTVDGELLEALRNGPPQVRMIPVIVLTGHDMPRPSAAEDYILRPFNARELLMRGHMQMQMGKRRVLLENAYEQRTDEMRLLMDELPVGVFRADPDGTTIYFNDTLHEMSGIPRVPGLQNYKELQNWASYVKKEFRKPLINAWQACLNSDQVEYTATAQWETGRELTSVTERVKKIFRFGECVALVGCVTDITEARLANELQAEHARVAEERLRDAENAKTEVDLLVDITSHEIRNPISSLMQCASMVRTNLVGLCSDFEKLAATGDGFQPTSQLMHTLQEDVEALDNIYACGLAQERISNDVLALGKAQLNLLEVHSIEVNIQKEMRRIANVFQNEARMGRIHLSLAFAESFRRLNVDHIMLDPVRFGQIVTNLLANAVRFVTSSRERRIDVHVDIGTSPPEGCTPPTEDWGPVPSDTELYLYVSATDTGPGLTPSELQTLFQRFSQANSKTHTIFGGSGLSLFVCRKITDLMGGRIEVTSKYGEGSVFRFFVKTRAAPRVAHKRTHSPAVPIIPRPLADQLSVLIVEDNLINRQVLARQLKHVGLSCEVAVNGLEAVQRLRGEEFDCILMDLEMPVMDGYTATRIVREEEKGARNAIIALTGNARQTQLEERMKDFDDVVVKPYRLNELLRKIENAAAKRKGSCELEKDLKNLALDGDEQPNGDDITPMATNRVFDFTPPNKAVSSSGSDRSSPSRHSTHVEYPLSRSPALHCGSRPSSRLGRSLHRHGSHSRSSSIASH